MTANELIEQLVSIDELEAALDGLVDDDALADMIALRLLGHPGCLPGIKPPAHQDRFRAEDVEENMRNLGTWLAHKVWEIKRDDN